MDKRIKKTKDSIKNTLLDLLERDDVSKITVTEMCNILDINRGTFYIHYDNIHSVLDEIEDEIICDIKEIVVAHDRRDPEGMLLAMGRNVREHKREWVALSAAYLTHFINKVTLEMKVFILQIAAISDRTLQDKEAQNYISVFLISGGIGVLLEWLRNDCNYPERQLIKDISRYINSNSYFDMGINRSTDQC